MWAPGLEEKEYSLTSTSLSDPKGRHANRSYQARRAFMLELGKFFLLALALLGSGDRRRPNLGRSINCQKKPQ